MLIFYIFLIITIKYCASTGDYLQHPLQSCNVGDTVQNECNKCICTSKAIFECTALNCTNNSNILKEGEETSTCHPNQLYAQNLISCICTKDGKWPHKSCHDTFHNLPPTDVIKHTCQPNTYVIIDCNVCKCGPTGVILNNQCTKNACDDDSKRRMLNKPSNVYGSCEINNWYSLAPCQFCYCANENRLVCNTGNHYSKNLELGSYNLVVCGKDLIKDAMELVPDHEKVLRLGLHEELKQATSKTTLKVQSVQQIDINVNKKEKKVVKSKISQSDDEEYYSDTEEQKSVPTTKATTTVTTTTSKIISTQNPYQEGDETNNDNDYDSDKKEGYEEDSSNEIGVEVPVTVATAKPEIPKFQPKDFKSEPSNAETLSAFGETLKINLPKVLNKVFQMALRKSMVSLNSESKCTPGTTSVKECNMCFCLRNSKLLCTNNSCN